jgi:hypothetical protein
LAAQAIFDLIGLFQLNPRRTTMKNFFMVAGITGVMLCNIPLTPQDGYSMSSRGRGPSIVISSRPSFIDLPDQGFSVSIGSPYDIVNYDNRYYIYNDGSWYNSSDYRGPWIIVREDRLPERIRRHRPEDIRNYRDRESRRRDGVNNQNQHNNENRNR